MQIQGSSEQLKRKPKTKSEIKNERDLGVIKVANFVFLVVIFLGIPFRSSFVVIFMVLSVFGLGFVALPLYIYENLKGTEFSNEAYLYLSSIVTFFLSCIYADILYALCKSKRFWFF